MVDVGYDIAVRALVFGFALSCALKGGVDLPMTDMLEYQLAQNSITQRAITYLRMLDGTFINSRISSTVNWARYQYAVVDLHLVAVKKISAQWTMRGIVGGSSVGLLTLTMIAVLMEDRFQYVEGALLSLGLRKEDEEHAS